MTITELAEALKSGSITLAQWEAGMRDIIKEQFTNAMIASKGGREFVTQSDWGFLGSLLKKQYQYLDNFASQIAANPEAWMNGRLNMRMELYQKASYAAFQEMVRREHKENGYDEERRVLGAADHCFTAGTLIKTAKGDIPIESICMGDYVLTRFGNRRVTRTYKRWVDKSKVYMVASNGRTITVTGNHPLYTNNGWKNVENLSPADDVMLYENGRNQFFAHVAFPYPFHNVPTLGQVGVSRLVSGLLFNLPFIKRVISRVTVPPIPVCLNDNPVYYNVNDKVWFNKNLFVVCDSEFVKNFPELSFKSARLVLLNGDVVLNKPGDVFWSAGIASKILDGFRSFGWVVVFHVFSRSRMDDVVSGVITKPESHLVGFISHNNMVKSKFFSNPLSAVLRVVGFQKGNFIGSETGESSICAGTIFTGDRIPIFSTATPTNKAARLWHVSSSALLAKVASALSNFAAQLTSLVIRTGRLVLSTFDAQGYISLSSVSTIGAGAPIHKGFDFEFSHNSLLRDSDKNYQVIPRSVLVYNLEVEEVNEYIANDFIVHNCNGCLEQAALGWQPIGTLDPIGAEECNQNCQCQFEYRRSSEAVDMLFAPGLETDMLFAPQEAG